MLAYIRDGEANWLTEQGIAALRSCWHGNRESERQESFVAG